MGKVIDKIKSWFKRKPRLEERYTLNRKYLGRSEDLKIFIEKRQYQCDMLGVKFSVIEKRRICITTKVVRMERVI